MNELQFKTKRFSQSSGTLFGIAPSDMLEDVFGVLAIDNEQRMEHPSVHAGSFKQPKIIELVFLLSEHWCQDCSTKYQAVEILDRFMILHVEQLYKSTTEKMDVTDMEMAWTSVKTSLCDRFLLFLVSCIQIASKLNFLNHTINVNLAIQFLRSAGHSYKKEELLKSEIIVLKTLDFRINIQSPFMFIEVLLEVLGYNGCLLTLKDVLDMCVMVLDLVYLMRNPIYETLLKATVDLQSQTSSQRCSFLAVMEDQMLLATGVIAASTFIINQNSWNEVLKHLSDITGNTVNAVFDISSSILKHSIGVTMP
ncbi:cyclin N-terminal domain-containing protein 1 isoform X2 [Hyperolius riggenbachi]